MKGVFMANRDEKVAENTEGRYYVDTQCIDCNLCINTAPGNFTHNEEAGYAFVTKQPSGDDEEDQCKEALEACPVEAIGNDGE